MKKIILIITILFLLNSCFKENKEIIQKHPDFVDIGTTTLTGEIKVNGEMKGF